MTLKRPKTRPHDPLQAIPGVGPVIAWDLGAIGIHQARQLTGRNAERLYERVNQVRGARQDRSLLYVLRCAVYYASTARPRPRLLKWWSWSDANRSGR